MSGTVPKKHQRFNPRAPWGARRGASSCPAEGVAFQSTRPVGGATVKLSRHISNLRCFNPRAPWGGDQRSCSSPRRCSCFNPRAPWGARLFDGCGVFWRHGVSIHAPRGGRDDHSPGVRPHPKRFNPRAPWGARLMTPEMVTMGQCFNPRAPWGARLFGRGFVIRSLRVSIHAPRGGRDRRKTQKQSAWVRFNPRAPWGARRVCIHGVSGTVPFQSTRPVGGATSSQGYCKSAIEVSIHAPRGGRDLGLSTFASRVFCFNPRAPWGARLFNPYTNTCVALFQSTRPVGGATPATYPGDGFYWFQSTRPVGGATTINQLLRRSNWFQSTRPVGGATRRSERTVQRTIGFNPRAPWGARRQQLPHKTLQIPFQSTRPVGGATDTTDDLPVDLTVSIHAPRGGRDDHQARPG